MTDNVNVSPSGATPIAADDVGGVLHQRVKAEFGVDGVATDVSGINPMPVAIAGENPAHRLFIPPGAAGASKVHFDLFNAAGSGKTLRILSVVPIVSGKAAVTGVLAVDLYLTRTTTVGTGGTAATAESASLTAPSLTRLDPADAALPAQVTARVAPTGGGTAGAVIGMESVFTEETNAATYFSSLCDFVRRALGPAAPPLLVAEGTGIRVVQDAVASVGNIGFDVIFEVV